jgi:hypothetical protein
MERGDRRSGADPGSLDEDLPPWADPGSLRPSPRPHRAGHGESSARAERAGPERHARGRAQAARARRAKRRVVTWGGVAAGAAVIAILALLLSGGSAPKTVSANGFVTTYLPGEYRSVPDACTAVPAAVLNAYLPGKRAEVAIPALTGRSGSQCDWTLDQRPVYRLLDVNELAYAPNGLASGNGSATAAAEDAYGQAMQAELHPPRGSHQPKAAVTALRGAGDAAFSAFQVITVGGDTTEKVTVVTRLSNVLVTVEFSGLDHADQGGYGPVSASQLAAGALATARGVLNGIR